MNKITPCLWFDDNLQEAMDFYLSVFPDGEITSSNGNGGQVFTATFRLAGQEFQALNGGPGHPFTDALSLTIDCVDQAEVDYYWDALTAGDGAEVQCGWLVDPFGLSWQVVPRRLVELLGDPDPERAQRAIQAMLGMVKIDVAELERAANG